MSPPSSRRVVITGIGLVTPLGRDRETSCRRLVAGDRAVRRLVCDPDGRLRAPQDEDAGDEWIGAPAAAGSGDDERTEAADPVTTHALAAAREAVRHAGLDGAIDPARTGCVLGTSKGGLNAFRRAMGGDPAPDLWQAFLPNASSLAVAGEFDVRGPVVCPVAACATGLVSIVRGADLVASGKADVVLAGSSDASLLDLVVGSFRRLGVHARRSSDPASACRPYDRSRDGFVVGEGAAVLVLEEAGHAERRGANVVAEYVGGRLGSDASGATQLDESGNALAHVVRNLLAGTRTPPEAIDHVQLHGTGTRANDLCEARALKTVFGRAARDLACSSAKGAIGHLLGAAGSVETAFALLAMRDGIVPPTANLLSLDPMIEIGVSGESRALESRYVLKTSLGFGGHVAAALFARPGASLGR